MNNPKYFRSLAIAAVSLLLLVTAANSVDECTTEGDTITSGTCGTDLEFSYDSSTGLLYIRGTGAMFDYQENGTPWNSYKYSIKTLTLPEGLTHIGNNAFCGCNNIKTMTIPSTVTSFGDNSFRGCTKLSGDINISASVASIGLCAFAESGIGWINVDASNPNYSSQSGVLLNKNGTKLIQCTIGNTKTLYTVPSTVTEIADYAFSKCNGFSGEICLSNVQVIGSYAFSNSGIGGTLTIPATVTKIKEHAFENCSNLEGSLIIPSGVTCIEDYAFYACDFTGNLTIAGGTSIGDLAFCGCLFSGTLSISAAVTDIGTGSFAKTRFSTITVDSASNSFTAYNDILFTKDMSELIQASQSNTSSAMRVIPAGTVKIRGWAFEGCDDINGTLQFPDSLTYIGEHAFCNCYGLTGSISIPYGVTYIGDYAFDRCVHLYGNINLSSGLETIGDHAFSQCIRLTGSLTIPDSVTSIGDYAFYRCSGLNGTLTLSSNLVSIGEYAFQDCSGLTGVAAISDSVTSIGQKAFQNCSGLSSLTIGTGVNSIGSNAFDGCTGVSGSVSLPTGLTYIGNNAFSNTTLSAINISSGNPNYASSDGIMFTKDMTRIIQAPKGIMMKNYTIPADTITVGQGAFKGCTGLTGSLTISNTVTTIENYAFSECSGITSVYIGTGLTSIGVDAFKDCFRLAKTVNYSNLSIGSDSSNGCIGYYALCRLVNKDSYPIFDYEYQGNTFTFLKYGTYYLLSASDVTGELLLPSSFSCGSHSVQKYQINKYAFYNCSGISGSLAIPDSVSKIGKYAFSGCTGLNDRVSVSGDATVIEDYAFSGCSGISGTLFIYSSNGTTIGIRAFENCTGLSGLYIGEGVTSINNYAFSGCTGVTSINLPSTITKVGKYAFQSFTATGDVTIEDGAYGIDSTAFSGMKFYSYDGVTEITNISDLNGYTYVGTADKLVKQRFMCQIRYDANGGDAEEPAPVEVEKNVVIILADYCGTNGLMYFAGWTDGTYLYEAGSGYTATKKDVLMTAVWVLSDIKGDLNGDQQVNNEDLTLLKQSVAGWDVEIIEDNADYNNDGFCNIRDVLLLRIYLGVR